MESSIRTISSPNAPVAQDRRVRRRGWRTGLALLVSLLGACVLLVPAAVSSYGASTESTLWGSKVPAHPVDVDPASVELGTRFTPRVDGSVTRLRLYRTTANRGPHVASLWTGDGTLLGRVTMPASTPTGWVSAPLRSPVRVKKGAAYVVSYLAPRGRYAGDTGVFSSGRTVRTADLTATAGVYRYGGGFPTDTYRGTSYYVDVSFARALSAPRPSAPATSTSAPTSPASPSPSASVVAPAPSPTATASAPAPSPTSGGSSAGRTGCASRPSACGYPDASNTGVATGAALVAVPGSRRSGVGWAWSDSMQAVVASSPGATLDHLDVKGQVVIDAPDVTLSNSRISACGGKDDNDVVAVRYRSSDASYRGSGAKITGNTIIGTPSGCSIRARSGVRDIYGEAPNLLVQGNDISGTGNGVTVEYQGLVVDNWVHDLGHVAGDHHSGISTHGGAKQVVFRHNTVLLYGQKFAGGGGVSGAVTVYSDFGHAQNALVEDNFVSGGSYVMYGGNSGDGYRTPSTNVQFRGNRFMCGDWLYGPVMAFDASSTGNAWSGNLCDQDGSVVES